MLAYRVTFVVRRCCSCHKTLGIRVWRWQGGWGARTHGLCARCLSAMEPAGSRERP